MKTESSGVAAAISSAVVLRANCLVTDLVGDAFYISADRIGDLYQITKVDIDDVDITKAEAIGIIRLKIDATTCYIQLFGELSGVYSGLTPNARLFVDTTSQLREGPPAEATGRLFHQIARASAADVIFIDPKVPIRILT